MAEILQCPVCLQWLNLELYKVEIVAHYLEVAGGIEKEKCVYKCRKCGGLFSEDREKIFTGEEANNMKIFVGKGVSEKHDNE